MRSDIGDSMELCRCAGTLRGIDVMRGDYEIRIYIFIYIFVYLFCMSICGMYAYARQFSKFCIQYE